jgi:hypothetical protein
MSRMNMIQALNSALDVALTEDPNTLIFGGVFRVTDQLQKKHGLTRCFDSPISEGGIVATAIGMGPMACGRSLRSNLPITFCWHSINWSRRPPGCAIDPTVSSGRPTSRGESKGPR